MCKVCDGIGKVNKISASGVTTLNVPIDHIEKENVTLYGIFFGSGIEE